MSFIRTRLLLLVSVFFSVLVVLFFGGAYQYVKDELPGSELIVPIPLDKPNPGPRRNIIKAQVLGVKTIDDYPPSSYFPQDWQPLYGELGGDNGNNINNVEIKAQAYLIYDKTAGQILYAKNHTQELPIASLTKIMTALVTLDNADINTRFIVPEEAIVGEAFMGLDVGELVKVVDLLYGILLNSGNDAAETLAYGVGGIAGGGGIRNRKVFIKMMNEKAQELGMYDTYFVNPTGLDEETVKKSSFSTALDLLALTSYALENEEFRKIVATKYWTVPYMKNKHKAFFLTNKLDLNRAHPAIKGVKPGTTDFAGNTLVSYGELDGEEYILIMLNSPHVRDETVEIYKMLYGK